MNDSFVSKIKEKVGLKPVDNFQDLIGRKVTLRIFIPNILKKPIPFDLGGTILSTTFGPNDINAINEDYMGARLSLKISNSMIVLSRSYSGHFHRNQENRIIFITCDNEGLLVFYTTTKPLHDTGADQVVEEKVDSYNLSIIPAQ